MGATFKGKTDKQSLLWNDFCESINPLEVFAIDILALYNALETRFNSDQARPNVFYLQMSVKNYLTQTTMNENSAMIIVNAFNDIDIKNAIHSLINIIASSITIRFWSTSFF